MAFFFQSATTNAACPDNLSSSSTAISNSPIWTFRVARTSTYSALSESRSGAASSKEGAYRTVANNIPANCPSNPTRPFGTKAAWRHFGCTEFIKRVCNSDNVGTPVDATEGGNVAHAVAMTPTFPAATLRVSSSVLALKWLSNFSVSASAAALIRCAFNEPSLLVWLASNAVCNWCNLSAKLCICRAFSCNAWAIWLLYSSNCCKYWSSTFACIFMDVISSHIFFSSSYSCFWVANAVDNTFWIVASFSWIAWNNCCDKTCSCSRNFLAIKSSNSNRCFCINSMYLFHQVMKWEAMENVYRVSRDI